MPTPTPCLFLAHKLNEHWRGPRALTPDGLDPFVKRDTRIVAKRGT